MHMNTVNIHTCIFYDTQQMRNLMYADTKFTIDMTNRNIGVSTGHHVWIDTYANRSFRMFCAKLLQNRKVVNIDLNPHFCNFFKFVKRHAIRCKHNFSRIYSGSKSESYFLNTYGIHTGTKTVNQLKNCKIRQGLYSIVYP